MPKKIKKATPPAPAPKKPVPTPTGGSEALGPILEARELFWQNVIREMLTSLAVMSTKHQAAAQDGVAVEAAALPEGVGNIFDGRLAVITQLGQRVPIAGVVPLFACGIPTPATDQALSLAVECTVFQINTPDGEVYTLPLHEIRTFHSLSEGLIDQLSQAQTDGGGEPFGFAAYTSLARTRLPGAYGVVPPRYPLNPSEE